MSCLNRGVLVFTFEHSPWESGWRSISGIVDLSSVAVVFMFLPRPRCDREDGAGVAIARRRNEGSIQSSLVSSAEPN